MLTVEIGASDVYGQLPLDGSQYSERIHPGGFRVTLSGSYTFGPEYNRPDGGHPRNHRKL